MTVPADGPVNRLEVAAIGDSFVPAETFRRAIEDVHLDVKIRTVDIDEKSTWVPLPGTPPLREYAGHPEEVARFAAGADVLLVHVAPVTRDVLESLPNLRFLGVARGGPVNVDLDAATELGLPVVTTPGRNATAVTELTIALTVMMLRRLPEANAFARASDDLGRSAIEGAPYVGRELREIVLGLIGFGAVGQGVAEVARRFGARVMVHDPYVSASDIAAAGCEPSDLDHMLSLADVTSLHVRATSTTENLVDGSFLGHMKPGAILINTSRETVVDEAALVTALDTGRLAAAALDVVRPSDRTPHPLALHPRAFVLPHVGGATAQSGTNGAVRLAGTLRALLEGAVLPDVVNDVSSPRR